MGKEAQTGLATPSAANSIQAASLPPTPKPDIMALCALAGAMFLWSGTFIAMKVALEVLHPVHIVGIRMVASSLMLLPFFGRWTAGVAYTRGDWRFLALLVFAEPCLYFIFEGYALRYTTASQAGLITALLPLLVGVSAFIFLKERLPKKVWAGFLLAVIGVIMLTLSSEDSETAPNAVLGNVLELVAMGLACVYTLCARKLKAYPAFLITTAQVAGGAAFFVLLSLVMDIRLPDALPAAPHLAALIFLSVSTVAAYSLYNLGIARLSAGQAAAWINLIPALTLLLGIVVLKETLTVVQCFAVLPIVAGVALSQMGKVKT